MSTTARDMNCSPHDVFDVLGDGWLFPVWVVGAARIRDVDDAWPLPGSEIHHSVGSWPLLISDTTSVVELVPDRYLRLRVRAWPAGEGDVQITVEPTPTGCRVTIVEAATRGPGRFIPKPLLDVVLHARNKETLRRLSYLAERRVAGRPGPADSDDSESDSVGT